MTSNNSNCQREMRGIELGEIVIDDDVEITASDVLRSESARHCDINFKELII
jgi:hypothetical protein